MNREQNPKSARRQRGGALVAVLGFAVLASAIVLLSLSESQTQMERVKLDKNQRLARLAAELGIQASLRRLKKGLPGDCDGHVDTLFAAPAAGEGSSPGGGNGNGNGNGGSPTTEASLFASPETQRDADEDGFLDFAEGQSFAAQRAAFAAKSSGSFASRVQLISGNTYRIRCMAVDEGLVRVFEAVARPQELDLPGLVSRSTLTVGSGSLFDSYNSAAGYFPLLKILLINGLTIFGSGGIPILDTYDRAEGTIYAQDGVITSGSARLLSNILLGPAGTTSGPGMFGAINSLPDPIDPPPPTYNPPATNNNADPGFASFYDSVTGSLLISPSQTAALGADGTATAYVLPGGLQALSNSEMVIRGDVTLYVDNGMTLDSNSTLTMATDATLTIVSDGQIDFRPAVNYVGNHRPKDLRILQASSDPITLASNAALRASIEAPLANVDLAANIQFFGAVVGNAINMGTNVRYHWDETLKYTAGVDGLLGLSVIIEVK